jgi:hypothetical protein
MSSASMRGRAGSSFSLSFGIMQQMSNDCLLPLLMLLMSHTVKGRTNYFFVSNIPEISISLYPLPTLYPSSSTRRHGTIVQCQRVVIRSATCSCSTWHCQSSCASMSWLCKQQRGDLHQPLCIIYATLVQSSKFDWRSILLE